MISDRPYMRGDYQRETTSVATWLICAIVGAFVIQFATELRSGAGAAGFTREFTLSIDGLAAGRIWTLLTHWLLHSTGNLFHVSLVAAGLYLLGRELVRDLGSQRFLGVFGASILTGAAVWSAVNWRTGGELIGSTAGLYGLVAVFALLYPNREISLLLFFFFPVTFRPKHVAIALLVADAFALVLLDILDRSLPFTYAPSAHLGGMMAGWTYYQFFHETEWRIGRNRRTVRHRDSLDETADLPAADREGKDEPATTPDRSREDIRVQVDRILDKINSEGLASLTPAERRILDSAKELLSRR